MKNLICFLILGMSVLPVNSVIAEVPFDIKLPFPAGERRGITCIYHDTDPNCITHAEFNSKGKLNGDEWAIDFNLAGDGDNGKPVVAIASGTVVESAYIVDFNDYGYGNYIDIDHKNGYKSRYAHLSSRKVSVNDEVSQGQEIGKTGDTGAKDNYHLHFALYKIGADGSYPSVKPTPMSGYNEFYSTAGTADYPFISNNYFTDFNFNDGASQGWMPGNDARNIPFVSTRSGTWVVGASDFDGVDGTHPGVLSPIFNGLSTNHFSSLRFTVKISTQLSGVKQGDIWIKTSDGDWNHNFIFTHISNNGGGFHTYQAAFTAGLAINQISIELTRNNVYEEWEFDEIRLMERKPMAPNLKIMNMQ